MRHSLQNTIKKAIVEHWQEHLQEGESISDLEDISKYHISALNHMNQFFDNHLDISTSFLNTNQSAQSQSKQNDEANEAQTFTFHRQLTGGSCINEFDDIYAPEGVVRNLNLEHGDKVLVLKNKLGYNRHYYEKLDDLPQDKTIKPNEISAYDFAIVTSVPDIEGRFIVKKHYGDEGLTSIPSRVIHGNDVQKFELKDGDLVHIAFYEDSQFARVRWKYSQDEPIPTPKPQKSSVYKNNTSSNDDVEQSLEGLTIGIVGYGNLDTSYEEEITKRGGLMLSTSSVDSDIIENKVRQSDIVVMPTHYMGHGQMDITKTLCKEYNKPLVIINKGGRSHFINQIHDVLDELK